MNLEEQLRRARDRFLKDETDLRVAVRRLKGKAFKFTNDAPSGFAGPPTDILHIGLRERLSVWFEGDGVQQFKRHSEFAGGMPIRNDIRFKETIQPYESAVWARWLLVVARLRWTVKEYLKYTPEQGAESFTRAMSGQGLLPCDHMEFSFAAFADSIDVVEQLLQQSRVPSNDDVLPMPNETECCILQSLIDGPLKGEQIAEKALGKTGNDGRLRETLSTMVKAGWISSGRGRNSTGYSLTKTGKKIVQNCRDN